MAIEFDELGSATSEVADLFRKSFHGAPPDIPRHFAAYLCTEGRRTLAAYMHFTVWKPGIFLIGGLCVDARCYRRMSGEERRELAASGSLARRLSDRAIEMLGAKRAVFAYTGDQRSRRDALALGFVPAAGPYLFVQWHEEPVATRAALIEEAVGLGPF